MNSGNAYDRLKTVEKDIAEGKILPVYLVTGSEEFLVSLCCNRIIHALKTKKGIQIEDSLDYEKTTPRELILKAQSPSLFNPYQLMVVKNVPWFTADKSDLAEPFKEWLPIKDVVSTIVMTADQLDGRLGVSKKISKHGCLLKFDKLKSYDQGNINRDVYYPVILERLSSAGQTFDADAWQLLRQRTSDDLWSVVNATDVVSAYAGENKRITLADVNACVYDHSDMPGYKILDAMIQRDPLMVRSCIEKSLKEGFHGLMLNKMIANRLRALLMTHSLGLQKQRLPNSYGQFNRSYLPKIMPAIESNSVAAKTLGTMKPYALFMLLKQCAQMQTLELADCLKRIGDVDLKLKSTTVSARDLLEKALLPVCHSKRRHRGSR